MTQPDDIPRQMQNILSREDSLITQYENLLSAQAFDLLSRLLKYNPEERIGGGPDGVTEIK